MMSTISWKFFIVSLVATPICLVIAALSGGAGHGSYTIAILLFPYAALSAIVLDRFFDSTAIMILVAIMELPTYGLLLGIAEKRKRFILVAVVLVILHTLMLVIAFSL
jgi:hypothetical protein